MPSDPEEDRRQIAEAVQGRKTRRRHRAGDRRQRADIARGVVAEAHGRSCQPRNGRPAGRTGERDARDRQAGHRVAVQRPAALDQRSERRTCPAIFECWYLGQETRHSRGRSACSAISIPAANCRSRFRVRSAICRPSTTTSPRRGAAICSTMFAALSVRFRSELHDVLVQQRSARENKDST